jgi:hypothetical protein
MKSAELVSDEPLKELSHATERLAFQFTTKSVTVHDEGVDNSGHLA